MSYQKNWCFTLNNYTDENLAVLETFPCTYIIYGKEVGEQGTPHLQGYVQMEKRTRMTALRKLLQCHWSPARGTPEQNKVYCSKEGDVYERGVPTVEGQRADIRRFMDDVQSGVLDKKRLREDHPAVCAKYPRFVEDYIQDNMPELPLPMYPLKGWQSALIDVLITEPDDRTVVFIVDRKGGAGKTWFAKYYCRLHNNAQVIEMGKKSDMAHALRTDIRVLFVNCTRSHNEFMNYGFLESVKDGIVFSGKYESRMKTLGPCHVVVLMNEDPDRTKLSEDRYDVLEVNK